MLLGPLDSTPFISIERAASWACLLAPLAGCLLLPLNPDPSRSGCWIPYKLCLYAFAGWRCAAGVCPAHGLFATAGEDGQLECFDLRQRTSVGLLEAAAAAGAPGKDEYRGRLRQLRRSARLREGDVGA